MISLEEKCTERTFTLTLDEKTLEFLHAVAYVTGGVREMYDLANACEGFGVGLAELDFRDGCDRPQDVSIYRRGT